MIAVYPVANLHKREVWQGFAPYHYLAAGLNLSARCWVVAWDDNLVAFTSALTMPSGTLTGAWREHRTVVLPDYQGLGLGAVLTDWLGQHFVDQGNRFYSRTSHPRLAAYRRSSVLWRETKKSGQFRREAWHSGSKNSSDDRIRPAFSFEYVGLT